METINVIIKEPGKLGYEKQIPNTLDALQAEVGGYIEVVNINSRLVAIVNEEGRMMNLPANICGLIGTIAEARDTTFVIEIAPKVSVEVARAAVTRVLKEGEAATLDEPR